MQLLIKYFMYIVNVLLRFVLHNHCASNGRMISTRVVLHTFQSSKGPTNTMKHLFDHKPFILVLILRLFPQQVQKEASVMAPWM